MRSVDDTKVEKDNGTLVLILDNEYVVACAAAPLDYSIADYFSTNKTLFLFAKNGKMRLIKNEQSETATPPSHAIQMTTERKHIPPELFKKDRKLAMRKTPSSKYDFRYNFGGYIPNRAFRKNSGSNLISADDFDDYICCTSFCDFLPMVCFQEKRRLEKESNLEAILEEEQLKQQKLEKEKQLKRAREERVKRLFTKMEDYWNAEVLDYIGQETQNSDFSEVEEELDEENAEFFVTYADRQKQLELIWNALDIPQDQKLDMAIKYGSHKFTKLENVFKVLMQAIKLWSEVADLIIKREQLLSKIEAFEMTASDPM